MRAESVFWQCTAEVEREPWVSSGCFFRQVVLGRWLWKAEWAYGVICEGWLRLDEGRSTAGMPRGVFAQLLPVLPLWQEMAFCSCPTFWLALRLCSSDKITNIRERNAHIYSLIQLCWVSRAGSDHALWYALLLTGRSVFVNLASVLKPFLHLLMNM